jgi:cyclic-di-GMP-binding protein
MPSFDIVSEVDKHELSNAIDQANREITTRFDLKGTSARIDQEENVLTLRADNEFQVGQVMDILRARLSARQIDVRAMDVGKVETNLAEGRQKVTIKQGIEQPMAKKIIAKIKEAKLKVEAQINAEKIRVTGKKRDDLQTAMAMLRKADLEIPLQFENFRD